MREELQIKAIVYSERALTREEVLPDGILRFFDENRSGPVAESVGKKDEQWMVKWLFERSPARDLLREELGLKADAPAFYEKREPFITGNDTDIDVIAFDRDDHRRSLALQCKLIKADSMKKGSSRSERVDGFILGKLKGLNKCVTQSNFTYEKKFYATYMIIVALVDGRGREPFNALGRGLTNKIRKRKIYDFPRRGDLRQEIGIALIEVVQTSNRPFAQEGSVGITIIKKAVPQDQAYEITTRIEQHLIPKLRESE
jgi:hypothetical protein